LTLNGGNQRYRVDIMDPNAPSFDTGAGVLLNLFQTLPGDPNSLGYTTLNFDLSSFAGSTVRIKKEKGSCSRTGSAVTRLHRRRKLYYRRGRSCNSPPPSPNGDLLQWLLS